MRKLLSGNEAIARGAWEAGAGAAFGYPGTPSTEILENLVLYKDVYCEWSPNEKVAMECAAGAALAGTRSIVTMKCVGLNVAADPLMTLSYIGIKGGLVLCVCDDPGQHSSQTEQDTRHYARLAKIPVIEPADAADCRSYMLEAFEISERYRCPVILRSTTCVSHSRCLVTLGERRAPNVPGFERNVPQFVPLPLWGRKLRVKVEERMEKQAAEASASFLNEVLPGKKKTGLVSFGVTALHCRELLPDYPLLKLGWAWPFPDELLKKFCASCDRVIAVEEGDPILEEHIRSLGIPCEGKSLLPRCGEFTPARILELRAKLEGDTEFKLPSPVPEAADLPGRPPILCAGCPHRGLFYALGKLNVIVSGDIGCYSLGVFPPLNATDTILCMGGGFTVAHGMEKGGEPKKVVGIVGDSTFFHSGMTGLLNVAYNHGRSTLVVVDNRITAMTGHQDHPGTGKTLAGDATFAASIEEVARACGFTDIQVVDPYDYAATRAALEKAIAFDGPSLVISRAPCPLHLRSKVGPERRIDADKCRNCRACLGCGCPAIEAPSKTVKPVINAQMCAGCRLCEQLCKFGAITH